MKKVAIIGSGISATIAASVFLSSKYTVYMFDSENIRNFESFNNINKDSFKFLKSKFSQKSLNKGIKKFKEKYNISYKDFNLKSSLSTGGLSNYWGGGLEFPSEDYMKKYFKYKNILKEENAIKKLIGIPNKNDTDYYNFFFNQELIKNILKKKESKLFFEKTNLAIRQNKSEDRKKNTIFNALNEIKILKRNKNFYYLPDSYVEDFIKVKNGSYKVVVNNELKDTIFDKVIISAGTIGSSILVGRLLKIKSKIKICHHKMILFIYFSLKGKFRSLKGYDIPLLRLVFKTKYGVNKGGFAFSKDIDNRFFNISKKNFFFNYFKKFFFIGNFFMPSNLSNSHLFIKKTKVFLKTNNENNKINAYKNKLNFLLNKLLKENNLIRFPFKNWIFLKNGSDAHYTSSLINLKKNGKKILNKNCEISGFKNLHVIDGSVIKPGLSFPTYFIMMYSRYLSKEIIKNEKN